MAPYCTHLSSLLLRSRCTRGLSRDYVECRVCDMLATPTYVDRPSVSSGYEIKESWLPLGANSLRRIMRTTSLAGKAFLPASFEKGYCGCSEYRIAAAKDRGRRTS